ncbi:MAG TPA: hypothetical protein VIM71_03195 [Lacunisphaera sp.]
MRFFLKVLAVLCALLCALLAMVSVALMLSLWNSSRVNTMSLGGKVAMFGTFIMIASAGLYGVVRMVRHLRRPDATTARQVCAVAHLLFALQVIRLIHGNPARGAQIEWFGTTNEMLGSIAAGLATVLLYQFVLKGLAARSFPPTPESHA